VSAGLRLPAAVAWFRFFRGEVVHVGAVDPAGPHWFDLGPLCVHTLLAAGQLRLADLQARIAQAARMTEPARFAVPVPRPGKILCLAKNYVAHAKEMGGEAPPEPIFFAKLPDTLVAHGEAVVIPHWLETRVDHEAELGLVLGFADPSGRGAKYVDAAAAPALVAGYTPLNDVTARKLQGQDREQKYPWLRSKALDTFCPVGPFVVPADALDAGNLRVVMRVNGAVRQDANTRDGVPDRCGAGGDGALHDAAPGRPDRDGHARRGWPGGRRRRDGGRGRRSRRAAQPGASGKSPRRVSQPAVPWLPKGSGRQDAKDRRGALLVTAARRAAG
jgi:2-keto-4-pentenoate hydratase/2-oxohepta-3-ene-1,7-dioic acid hydratase in catechol pathway